MKMIYVNGLLGEMQGTLMAVGFLAKKVQRRTSIMDATWELQGPSFVKVIVGWGNYRQLALLEKKYNHMR